MEALLSIRPLTKIWNAVTVGLERTIKSDETLRPGNAMKVCLQFEKRTDEPQELMKFITRNYLLRYLKKQDVCMCCILLWMYMVEMVVTRKTIPLVYTVV